MDTGRPHRFEFGGFRLDRHTWSLLDPEGNPIGLTPKAFDALIYFVEHPGRVIDRATLLDALWPNTTVEENNLSQVVAALRRALGDGFIITVPRRGYQFVADVRGVANDAATASGPARMAGTSTALDGRAAGPPGGGTSGSVTRAAAGATHPERGPRAEFRARRVRPFLLVAGPVLVIAAVLAVAGGGLFTGSAQPAPRLAVLPFVDASPRRDQEHLTDAIATELLTTLSLIDGLHVTGRSSSFYFKDHQADLRTIGELLGIDYVLEGDIRSADDRLRISVRLTDAATGLQVWSSSYDRVVDDLFALQDDIARSVAQALEITLGVGELGTRIGTTRDAGAFMAFSDAWRILRRANRFSPAEVREAIPHLERAVALDETFALAWFELYAQLHWLDILAAERGAREPGAAARATYALARVVELTPQLPELVVSRLDASSSDGHDIARIFEQFLVAAEEMSYPPLAVLFEQARFLRFTGRVAESTPVLERTRVLDPLDGRVIRLLAEGYAAGGRPVAALELLDDFAAETGESQAALHGTALVIALQTGDEEEIVRRTAVLESDMPADVYARLARLLDDPERALDELRAFAASPDRSLALWPTMLAPWAAYFGDHELALEMYRHEVPFATGMTISRSIFDRMRRLEGFKDLVRDAGLVSYWRESDHWPDYCRPLGQEDFQCF